MTSFDPVEVSATLKIVWHERGTSHEAELKRHDLGLPTGIKEGKIRFAHWGGDKWRVK